MERGGDNFLSYGIDRCKRAARVLEITSRNSQVSLATVRLRPARSAPRMCCKRCGEQAKSPRRFRTCVHSPISLIDRYTCSTITQRREKLGKIYSVFYFSSVDVIMAGVATSSVKFLSPNRERERD